MRRQMKVTSVVLSTIIAASSVCGCGGSKMTESATTAAETTDSSYEYESAAEESAYCETEECPEPYEPYEPYETASNTESYEKPEENGYNLVTTKPLSTFAADVDTASYSNVRRMIEDGYTLSQINPDAVRPEEFINYFKYDLNDPKGDDKFGITTEITTCPWNEEHELMFVGMKTEDLDFDEAPASNLVFLIDVSGSMSDDNKLPLLQKSFDELIENLPGKGTISVVTYSGEEKVVLDGVSMKKKDEIKAAIDSLEASGCTNGEAGIQMAYKIAKENYIDGGINRVILATDGDLNVGISNPDDLEDLISEKKDDGVFLSVLGFGDGNLKDDNLERLADCGNGTYSYIDSLFEGKNVLVDEMGSTLVTVAKDVKLQVEFNPERVNSYRLIGYENRIMNDRDFNDDTKDGGEIGSGHAMTVMYEIKMNDGCEDDGISLRYQDTDLSKKGQMSDEWMTVSVRYKDPEEDESDLIYFPIQGGCYTKKPDTDTLFAAYAAECGMIINDSEYIGNLRMKDVVKQVSKLDLDDEYKEEFLDLIKCL